MAQLYAGSSAPRPDDPVKELKRFCKFHLEPGEKQSAVFTLDDRDFAVFDTEAGTFVTRPGAYRISLGYNVSEIAGSAEVVL